MFFKTSFCSSVETLFIHYKRLLTSTTITPKSILQAIKITNNKHSPKREFLRNSLTTLDQSAFYGSSGPESKVLCGRPLTIFLCILGMSMPVGRTRKKCQCLKYNARSSLLNVPNCEFHELLHVPAEIL